MTLNPDIKSLRCPNAISASCKFDRCLSFITKVRNLWPKLTKKEKIHGYRFTKRLLL